MIDLGSIAGLRQHNTSCTPTARAATAGRGSTWPPFPVDNFPA